MVPVLGEEAEVPRTAAARGAQREHAHVPEQAGSADVARCDDPHAGAARFRERSRRAQRPDRIPRTVEADADACEAGRVTVAVAVLVSVFGYFPLAGSQGVVHVGFA